MRIPTRIEEHEERFDRVAGRDRHELHQPAKEPASVLDPRLIVEEHPDRVETELAGHAQLGVGATRIVGLGLEHLELIDGVRRNVVRTEQLRSCSVLGRGAIRRPATPTVRHGPRQLGQRGCTGQHQRHLEGGPTMHDPFGPRRTSGCGAAEQLPSFDVGSAVNRHSVLGQATGGVSIMLTHNGIGPKYSRRHRDRETRPLQHAPPHAT